jgi:hypothetical protein
MSHSGNVQTSYTALGLTATGRTTYSAEVGIPPISATLAVGTAGVLTRSDADTAVVTLASGTGLTSGVYDVHWSGASRAQITGVISGEGGVTLTLGTNNAGSGSDFPTAAATPCVVQKAETFNVDFDGDNVCLIGFSTNGAAARITFLKDDGTTVIQSYHVPLGGMWGWNIDTGLANPLTGDAVSVVAISNGSSTVTTEVTLTGLQYEV